MEQDPITDSNATVEMENLDSNNYVKIGDNLVIDKRSTKKHPSFESFVSSKDVDPQTKKEQRRDEENIAKLTAACSTILVRLLL
ncbi:hypothetical protein M1146_06115 [Patescibacteria group bacterium]|nr:hypothetical protein [Patescibacteria group bacterium]